MLPILTDQKPHCPCESQDPGQEAAFTYLIITRPFTDEDIGTEYPTDAEGHCLLVTDRKGSLVLEPLEALVRLALPTLTAPGPALRQGGMQEKGLSSPWVSSWP